MVSVAITATEGDSACRLNSRVQWLGLSSQNEGGRQKSILRALRGRLPELDYTFELTIHKCEYRG